MIQPDLYKSAKRLMAGFLVGVSCACLLANSGARAAEVQAASGTDNGSLAWNNPFLHEQAFAAIRSPQSLPVPAAKASMPGISAQELLAVTGSNKTLPQSRQWQEPGFTSLAPEGKLAISADGLVSIRMASQGKASNLEDGVKTAQAEKKNPEKKPERAVEASPDPVVGNSKSSGKKDESLPLQPAVSVAEAEKKNQPEIEPPIDMMRVSRHFTQDVIATPRAVQNDTYHRLSGQEVESRTIAAARPDVKEKNADKPSERTTEIIPEIITVKELVGEKAPAANEVEPYNLKEEMAAASVKAGDAEKNISLTGVIKQGLTANPSLQRADYNRDLMRGIYEERLSQQGPQVTGYGNMTGDYDTSDQNSDRFTNTLRAEAGLRTNYTLYSFGAGASQSRAALKNVDKAGMEFAEQELSSAFEIASTYLELVRQREMVEIERYRLREHIQFLEIVERAFKAEQVQKSQLYLARTGLSQRKQSVMTAERQLRQVQGALERLLAQKIEPDSLKLPAAPVIILPDETAFIQEGLAMSPQIAAANRAIDAAQLEYDATQKGRYGAVNMNVDMSTDRVLWERNASTEFATTAAVEYSIPLYTSGGTQARLTQGAARMNQARTDLDLARTTLEEQLKLAYYVLSTSDDLRKLADREARDGQAVLDAFRGEVEYGSRSFSDVISQIDTVAAAKGRAISADISRTLAAYAILRFRGELLQYFMGREIDPGYLTSDKTPEGWWQIKETAQEDEAGS